MANLSKLNLLILILFGIVIGLGCYSFIYARGYSYMSDNPMACVNCHIMQENMNTWQRSSHHHVAQCNDCHLPHNIVGKYAVKAMNGFAHSAAFTLQNFHEPIRIKEHSLNVVKNSCISCHQPMIQAMDQMGAVHSDRANCLHCHRSTGHAR